ncbi:hypothetical protein Slin15195_G092140 [Septoria linicola]|uniref:Uncharacterized protein n=1 Tax=Septoria linicola TaxID=215465 RepID=A0A9Q9AVH5_9PEZI|nr:hypothetical protein Slin15195_G092140 [Septoria linicola]
MAAPSSSAKNDSDDKIDQGDDEIDNIRRDRESALHELLRKNKEQGIPETGPPPRPYAGLPKPVPGPWPRNHGGPIRITRLDDGTLTEYGEKLERERLEKMGTENSDGTCKVKEGERAAESRSDSC